MSDVLARLNVSKDYQIRNNMQNLMKKLPVESVTTVEWDVTVTLKLCELNACMYVDFIFTSS